VSGQLVRRGDSGKSIGLQLRQALNGLVTKQHISSKEFQRGLFEVGTYLPDKEAERLLSLYNIPNTKQYRLTQFIEDIDPTAFDVVFSSGTVSAASMQKVCKEIPLTLRESDGEIRNLVRVMLKKRIGQDGVQNVVRILRQHDSQRNGQLTMQDLHAALLYLGMKVQSKENMDRLWGAFAGTATAINIMEVANLLTRPVEKIKRKGMDPTRVEIFGNYT